MSYLLSCLLYFWLLMLMVRFGRFETQVVSRTTLYLCEPLRPVDSLNTIPTSDDVGQFLQANRKTAGKQKETNVDERPEADVKASCDDSPTSQLCSGQDTKQIPREVLDMAAGKPGDDFIVRERKESAKPKSHRHDALLKNRMAAVAKGADFDESTGRKSTQKLPRHLLEKFSEEEILDRAKIGGATGPRYSLRELGITSLEDFMVPEEDEEIVEKWQVMLRASSGMKYVNLYELWSSNHTLNECNPKLAGPDPNIKGVFKSGLAMAWNKVHEVRVSIFNRGERVFQMTFDASRADRLSWFSAEWLQQHPYKDLGVEPLDVFSMEGVTSNKAKKSYSRRFYAAKHHAACERDGEVWMMILDSGPGSGFCQLDKDLDLPAFLYSDGLEAVNDKELKRGDVFMIEGKIRYNPQALKRAQAERQQNGKQHKP